MVSPPKREDFPKPRHARFMWYSTDHDFPFTSCCDVMAGHFGRPSKGVGLAVAMRRRAAIRLLVAGMFAGGPQGLPTQIPLTVSIASAVPVIPPCTEPSLHWLIENQWVECVYLPNPKGSYQDYLAFEGAMVFAKKGKAAAGAYRLTALAWEALEGIDATDWQIHPSQLLIVRNERKQAVKPTEGPHLYTWREQLTQYNSALAHYRFSLHGTERPAAYFMLHRVFNSADYTKGGRFYSAFQNEASADRERLQIDGVSVDALDCRNLHGRLSLAVAGLACPEGDLYSIPGFDRSLVKEVWAAALNSPRQGGFTQGYDAQSSDQRLQALEAILGHSPALKGVFGIGIGLLLQRADSELVSALLDQFGRAQRPIIPIHDGFLVLPEDRALFEMAYRAGERALWASLRGHFPDLESCPLPVE